MRNPSRYLALAFAVPLLSLAFACSSTPTGGGTGGGSSSGGGSGGGSGSGSSSGGQPRCNQVCQDDTVAFAFDSTLLLLYNENIAGHPSGAIQVTATCPQGGTAVISGTDSVAQVTGGTLVTFNLSYDMTACGNSGSSFQLTFTGKSTWHGEFPTTGTPGDNAWSESATGLSITGTVLELDQPQVTETCTVALTDTWNHVQSSTGWLAGTVCGRTAGQ